jgi:hypothetical protein
MNGEVIVQCENRAHVCRPGNISATGMLIYPPSPLSPPSVMHILLTPDRKRWVGVEGHFVREATEREAYGWGVSFARTSPQVMRMLRELTRPR